MPPIVIAIAGVLQAIGIGFTASFFVAEAVVTLGVSVAISSTANFISQLTQKKPSSASVTHDLGSSRVSVRQPMAPWRVIYGRERCGGVFTYIVATHFDNQNLNLVLTVAGHQVTDILALYFDGVQVPVDVNGLGTGKYAATDGGAPYVYFAKKLGVAGEPAFPVLISEAPSQWTVNHRQDGRASCYLRLRWSADIFPNGVPNINFDVLGKAVYDPRTGLTAYSENPALCLRDYLTDTHYGLAATAAEIDDTLVIAAANICDQAVSLRAGGTEPQYSLNGSFTTDQLPKDIIAGLLSAMAGTLVYAEGKWKMYAGAFRGTSINLTDNDLRDSMKVQTLLSRRDLVNSVKGVYRDPNSNWQPGDFPPVQNAAYIAQDNGFSPAQNQGAWASGVGYVLGDCVFDNGNAWWCKLPHNSAAANEPSAAGGAAFWTVIPEHIWLDLAFQYTLSPSMAQRLAKIQLERARRQIDVTYPGRLNALQAEVADVVTVSHTRFGWNQKTFEVYNSRFTSDEGRAQGAPELACELGLRETDAAVYAWNPTTDETPLAFIGTVIQGNGIGGSTSKYLYDAGAAANGVQYQVSVLVKNQGTQPIFISSNFTTSAAVPAGTTQNVSLLLTGDGATHVQLIFKTNAAADLLNVDAVSPIIAKVSDGINLVPVGNRDFTGWAAQGGEAITLTQMKPSLPNMAVVQPPSNLVAATDTFTRLDGIKKTRIKVTWTSPVDTFVTNGGHILVEVSDHADGVPQVWRFATRVTGSETLAYYEQALNGHTYDVRITSENAQGAKSAAVEADGLLISDQYSQITSTSFGSQGSIRPTAYPTWTVAQNTNNGSGACTVRLTAPAATLPLTDGTSVNFPATDVTWNGTLAAATTYLFAPRQKIADGTIHFATGTGDNVDADPSTVPLTSAATVAQKNQLAMNQNHDGYYPMSDGWIQVTTPNNGGTGGGSSGGDPACVHEDELVEAITERGHGIYRLGEIGVGELIKGRDLATGEPRFRVVIARTRQACYDWYLVKGRKLTPCAEVWLNENALAWTRAHELGEHLVGAFGYKISLAVKADSEDDHNFCLIDPDTKEETIVHNGVIPRS
jgi:hypothetical protein